MLIALLVLILLAILFPGFLRGVISAIIGLFVIAFLFASASHAWEVPPKLRTDGSETLEQFRTKIAGMPIEERRYSAIISFRVLIRCSVASINDKYGRFQPGIQVYQDASAGDCQDQAMNFLRYCLMLKNRGNFPSVSEACYWDYLSSMTALANGAPLSDYSYSAPIPSYGE